MMKKIIALFTLFFVMTPLVSAGDDAVLVYNAWARPTANASSPAGVFMTINNTSDKDILLVGFSAENAAMTHLHEMTTNDGINSMVTHKSFKIPAKTILNFTKSHLHLMLMKMSSKITKGDSFMITLTFEGIGEMNVPVTVTGMEGFKKDME